MSAKQIRISPVDSGSARRVVEAYHYSGKAVNNSQLHLGAFYGGALEGVMSFGPPMDRSKVLPLVRDTPWEGVVELNRMAFSDRLPKNAESRSIAIAANLFRKIAPQVQWMLSFSDGTQCGDGTIYRASGFLLTGINRNKTLLKSPSGFIFTRIGFDTSSRIRARLQSELGNGIKTVGDAKARGVVELPGFQLRYVLPLQPGVKDRLTVPVLPYSEIDRAGAKMYRGVASEAKFVVAPGNQSGEGGASPTRTLSSHPPPSLHPPEEEA